MVGNSVHWTCIVSLAISKLLEVYIILSLLKILSGREDHHSICDWPSALKG